MHRALNSASGRLSEISTGGWYPGFVVESRLGIAASTDTSNEIIEKMSGVLKIALADPLLVKPYSNLGLQRQSRSMTEFKQYIDEDSHAEKPGLKSTEQTSIGFII